MTRPLRLLVADRDLLRDVAFWSTIEPTRAEHAAGIPPGLALQPYQHDAAERLRLQGLVTIRELDVVLSVGGVATPARLRRASITELGRRVRYGPELTAARIREPYQEVKT